MNRLISRAWFFPGLGAMLYLAGFNDAAIAKVGDGWLALGRVLQTSVVLVVLSLLSYLVLDKVKDRQMAYKASVRAAAMGSVPEDSGLDPECADHVG